MSLIQCQDCGTWISDQAAACPRCVCPAGAYNSNDYDSGYQQGGDHGSGILSGILKTAVGVALGNRLSENSKRNYMDSPNCERAKTGRRSSCWGCGLGDQCTMHGKY